MESHSLPEPVPDVIHQSLSDGAVLLLPAEEIYFGLNEVGAVIWSLLPPATRTFTELCDALCIRYPDILPATIEQDARELLDALLAQRLVTPVSTAHVKSGGPDSVSP